jgi:uncharacterized LabA/DUF88 family protein
MRAEPTIKRCIAYFDGQNLFHAARDAFGYTFPNYDPLKLAQALCSFQVWQLVETRFYTGVPDAMDKPDWSHFWEAKLAVMGSRGIVTYSRPLRYRNQKINNPDGSNATMTVGQEKGIDVRIALDVVRHSLDNRYDVALIFSQDQDFSEAVDDVRKISALNDRWIKVACAFPVSPATPPQRGINGCDWIRIDRRVYDSCIDPNDYRKRPPL